MTSRAQSVPQRFSIGSSRVGTLRAVILLAGSLGRNALADGVRRSILDLPVDAERTVLDIWVAQLAHFVKARGLPNLSILIAVDGDGSAPDLARNAGQRTIRLEVVRDPSAYRGTAGVVRDLTRDFDDDDHVLVATASQVQREPLDEVYEEMCAVDEAVSIVSQDTTEHAGAFLLRCARLRAIADEGFVDLKEQAIPATRGHALLKVVRRPHLASMPIRTTTEYLHALRVLHTSGVWPDAGTSGDSAFAETWRPSFVLVEPTAVVARDAVVQDSVVLAGGRVEKDAVVARSVVCPGAVVRRGQRVVEALVTA